MESEINSPFAQSSRLLGRNTIAALAVAVELDLPGTVFVLAIQMSYPDPHGPLPVKELE